MRMLGLIGSALVVAGAGGSRGRRALVTTPEAFFEGHPRALETFSVVREAVAERGPVDVRVTRSQVAFRARRCYAYLWLPGRWLRNPATELVLSIALDRRIDSPRFKEVAHAARTVWMHHLGLGSPADVDSEVVGWLREARERAS